MKKDLQNWYKATDILAKEFAFHYFGDDVEVWWVAGQIGGVLFINDRFYSIQDIVDYIQYKYSKKDMFDHHDTMLKNAEKGMSIDASIKNWRELRKVAGRKVKPNK
jgi:hypothetical protein